MDTEPVKEKRRKRPGQYLGAGIAIGVAIGVAIDNVGAGLAVGIAIGLAMGGRQKKTSENQKNENDTENRNSE